MIETLKDLEKLLKLCRKQGVTELNVGTLFFRLGEISKRELTATDDQEEETNFTEELGEPLSPEELTRFANGAA